MLAVFSLCSVYFTSLYKVVHQSPEKWCSKWCSKQWDSSSIFSVRYAIQQCNFLIDLIQVTIIALFFTRHFRFFTGCIVGICELLQDCFDLTVNEIAQGIHSLLGHRDTVMLGEMKSSQIL